MSLLFDGTSQYLSVADNAALTLPNGDWAISLWCKIASNAGTYHNLFLAWGHPYYAANPSIVWLFGEASLPDGGGAFQNKLIFRVNDGAGNTTDWRKSTNSYGTSSAWQHLLFQRSSGAYAQFINGVEDGAISAPTVGAVDRSNSMYLGADQNNTAPFNGSLAECGKWDRALSADERAALAAGFSPAFFPRGLAWHIPMCGDALERVAGLTVMNQGPIAAEHPPQIVLPPQPRFARGSQPYVHPAHVFRSPVVSGA